MLLTDEVIQKKQLSVRLTKISKLPMCGTPGNSPADAYPSQSHNCSPPNQYNNNCPRELPYSYKPFFRLYSHLSQFKMQHLGASILAQRFTSLPVRLHPMWPSVRILAAPHLILFPVNSLGKQQRRAQCSLPPHGDLNEAPASLVLA